MRTLCAAVTVGHEVEVSGWVKSIRDHGGKLFFDIEDASGVLQVLATGFSVPPAGSTVTVHGRVSARPSASARSAHLGSVELQAVSVITHSKAKPSPLGPDSGESARFKYRYLDLRARGSDVIKARARALRALRGVLDDEGFTEAETPILTAPTPEGAKEFLTEGSGGSYALMQSPQLYKQMLMVAGLEKYYQVARCFRDESGRADRQPEFTQIDVEASFMSEDEILKVAERVLRAVWEEISTVSMPESIPTLTWHEAMSLYGSDKPDLRRSTKIESYSGSLPFATGEHVAFIEVPVSKSVARKTIKTTPTPLEVKVVEGELVGKSGTVALCSGSWMEVQESLGRVRLALTPLETKEHRFCWVVRAPLFIETAEGLSSTHHPFTKPVGEFSPKALSHSYDMVCDGVELGGGSLRIHDVEEQLQVLESLGYESERAWSELGFFLEALSYGAPPHGGFAFGLDRILAVARGEVSIREVIAFPKTSTGTDPLTS